MINSWLAEDTGMVVGVNLPWILEYYRNREGTGSSSHPRVARHAARQGLFGRRVDIPSAALSPRA